MEQGIEQGIVKGLEQGRLESLSSVVWYMDGKGFSIDDISNNTGLPKTDVIFYLKYKQDSDAN